MVKVKQLKRIWFIKFFKLSVIIVFVVFKNIEIVLRRIL